MDVYYVGVINYEKLLRDGHLFAWMLQCYNYKRCVKHGVGHDVQRPCTLTVGALPWSRPDQVRSLRL